MANVYTYLKADGGNLTYSNTIDGEYQPVTEDTITARGVSGDKVVWESQGGIASIDAIVREDRPDNPVVFNSRGVAPVNPVCWSGKIRRRVGGRLEEKYSITWTDDNGVTHTLDPGVGGDDEG